VSTQPNRKPLLCPRNQIVSPFCVHATKSRAPAVSKQPNCEPLLCPHNQIVRQQQSVFGLPIGPLWAASSASALSPFPFCRLGQLPCCSPRLAFRNHPLGATGTGAGAAAATAAEAEAAWCCRTGGCLSLFMTGSDPSGLISGLISPTPNHLAGSKKKCRSKPAGQKTILMRSVIKKVR